MSPDACDLLCLDLPLAESLRKRRLGSRQPGLRRLEFGGTCAALFLFLLQFVL